MNLASFALPLSRLASRADALRGWVLSSMFSPRRAPAMSDREADHGADHGVDDEDCRRSLRTVLETQIIPRLTLSHREGSVAARPNASPRPPAADIAAFARCCVAGDRAGTVRIVETLRAGGLDQDDLLTELIAPAARLLGRQWEDDERSFSDVTLGLVRMHELIHAMGYEYHDGPQQAGGVRRVMLASAPGSQHVLGLSIVSEFFRKAGWQVVLEVSSSSAELCRAVRNEWFDVVGLSVGFDAQLRGLPALVAELKAAARNPGTPVLLGGPVFTLRDQPAENFGAQAICLDARESVQLAAALLSAAR